MSKTIDNFGMMIVSKYFESINDKRTKVLIPDSAHGTNPASAKMCGFDIIEVKSNEKGQVDVTALKELLDNEEEILEILKSYF